MQDTIHKYCTVPMIQFLIVLSSHMFIQNIKTDWFQGDLISNQNQKNILPIIMTMKIKLQKS